MKNITKKIALIENHDQAYYEWRKRQFRNEILIHIDPHIDYQLTTRQNINIGNFIYLAIKEKIISEIYWLLPGGKKEFKTTLIFIRETLKKIQRLTNTSAKHSHPIEYNNGLITTTLERIPLHISILETLPTIKKPVLLDVDIDFFVIDSFRKSSPLVDIGKRKPWIRIDKFVDFIKKKVKKIKFTTICYSVNGGYTPIIFKTLGDKLALKLGFLDKDLSKRLLAGENFYTFRRFLERGNIEEARKYFNLALILNEKYGVPDNNYGFLFLKNKEIEKAEQEFNLFLKVNPLDAYSLVGLAIVYIYKGKFRESKVYLEKAVRIDSNSKLALFYLSLIEFKLGNYKRAKKYILKCYKIPSYKVLMTYLLGRLHEKEGKIKLAEKMYQRALNIEERFDIPPGLEILI